jgi:serine/threonine-protein phosphatase 2A activator
MGLIDSSIKTEEQKVNTKLKGLLTEISQILNRVEPSASPQRFGNSAFRVFFISVKENSKRLVADHLHLPDDDVKDISRYLHSSFGNDTRIDYGTGHELNFLAFLYCLNALHVVEICEMFNSLKDYFNLVREVILKYNLEPAGSHGVWGLDDYQFLPFLYGSSELYETNTKFDELFEQKNSDLCYAQALNFSKTHKCRTEVRDMSLHSPILYQLRDVSWVIINRGMMDMYKNEVFGKFVVTQHFMYSRFLEE